MKDHLKLGVDPIERKLRDDAPRPGEDLIAALAASVPSRPRRRSRASFTAGVVALVVGTFASFGGLAYAADGASGAAKAAASALKSAAQDQYGDEEVVQPAKVTPAAPQKTVAVKSATTKSVPAKGTLPFTGISLVGTVVIGGTLVALGFALRRRESNT